MTKERCNAEGPCDRQYASLAQDNKFLVKKVVTKEREMIFCRFCNKDITTIVGVMWFPVDDAH